MSGASVTQNDVFGSPLEVPATHVTSVRAHRRRVAGPPPPSGEQLRDRALDKLETKLTRHAVEYVRCQLRDLYLSRVRSTLPLDPVRPFVNADDVDDVLRAWADCPRALLERKTQDWRGTVFRKGWTKTGTVTRSRRKHMHATDLPGWRPADATAPNR